MNQIFKYFLICSFSIFVSPLAFAGDAYLTNLNIQPYVKTNNSSLIKVNVKNASGSGITVFKIGWRLNNGINNISQNQGIGGGGITPGNSYFPYTHFTAFNVPTEGSHVLKVWVQAEGETNTANDTITLNFKALNNGSYVSKVNLFEQVTAQWCQYCPAASLVTANIKALPNTSVAVFHRSDAYDFANGQNYMQSYYNGQVFTPAAVFNQSENGNYVINSQHPQWLSEMNTRANSISPIELFIEATLSENNELNVDLIAKFKFVEEGNYGLNVYIVEDGIIGNQVNASSPYTHNNVVRNMMGGILGSLDVIPNTPILNTEYTKTYSLVLPNLWNKNNLRLIGIVFKKDGAHKQTLNAINYNFSGTLSNDNEFFVEDSFELYPNPTNDIFYLNFKFFKQGDYVSIYNLNGQMIFQQELTSDVTQFNASSFPKGVYLVKVKSSNLLFVKKLIKN